jgi:hypothetical protein
MPSPTKKCYCAFCRSERKVYRKRGVTLINIFASAAAATIGMLAIWQKFDPRVLIIFVCCLAVSEVFIRTRWRLNVICSECGFDPILYRRDLPKAVALVQKKLESRKNDPSTLLKRPLALPKVNKKAEAENAKPSSPSRGQIVSKQI